MKHTMPILRQGTMSEGHMVAEMSNGGPDKKNNTRQLQSPVTEQKVTILIILLIYMNTRQDDISKVFIVV